MNKVLKLLILSDVFIYSGLGLVAPLLAVFINDNLIGGTLFTIGIASAIFLVVHAVLQIVFADKFNQKDRRWMLLFGTLLIALVPLGYFFSKNIWHLFIVQFIYGVGASFAYPAWYSLFTANLEKKQEGFQWSINNSSISIGTALTAAIGGWLVTLIGFQYSFIIAGLITFVGFLILIKLNKNDFKK
jgi:MFS family permease